MACHSHMRYSTVKQKINSDLGLNPIDGYMAVTQIQKWSSTFIIQEYFVPFSLYIIVLVYG